MISWLRKEWAGVAGVSVAVWLSMTVFLSLKAAREFSGHETAHGFQSVSMATLFAVLTLLRRDVVRRHLSTLRMLVGGSIAAVGLVASLFSSNVGLQTQTLLLLIPLAVAAWAVQTRLEKERERIEEQRHQEVLAAVRSALSVRGDA